MRTLLTIICLVLLGTAGSAEARTYTSSRSRYDACRGHTGKEYRRCKARESRKTTVSRFSNIQTGGRLQRVRLREQLQQERLERNKSLLQKRLSYRRGEFNEDHNAQRAPYLLLYKQEQQRCMVTTEGRGRSRCLRQAVTNLQKRMRE